MSGVERIVCLSTFTFPASVVDSGIGTVMFMNIIVPISDVDNVKSSSRNVIGVVLSKNEDNLYQIGTKEGILQKLYSWSEYEVRKMLYILTK